MGFFGEKESQWERVFVRGQGWTYVLKKTEQGGGGPEPYRPKDIITDPIVYSTHETIKKWMGKIGDGDPWKKILRRYYYNDE